MPASAQTISAVVKESEDKSFDALYARAASMAVAGDTIDAERVLADARELQSEQLLIQMGVDLDRLRADSAYALVIGRTCYNRWLMGSACLALAHATRDPARRREAQFVLAQALHYMGRWRESERVWREMLAAKPEPALHGYLLYNLFFNNDGGKAHGEEVRRWSKMWVDAFPPPPPVFHVERRSDRKLRIGYLTPTFSKQVGCFLNPALEHHDRENFEVTMYVEDADKEVQFPGIVLKSVHDLTHRATAALIRKDKIDILVDLHGYFRLGRPTTLAQKPAPVQVSWLDYTHTRGLTAVDYVLHGDHMDAPGTAEQFVEKVWNLGKVVVPFRPSLKAKPSPAPCAERGYVTFACFNHPAKLSDPTVENWARILKACPTARLVLKYAVFDDPVLRAETSYRFAAHGADPAQLVFSGHSNGDAYEQAFAEVDIALDPSPVNGGTTTMEALSRSVPVLTLRGGDFYACIGVHSIMAIGMPEMVAESWDEYVQKACDLAGDIKAVQRLRAMARPALDASPYRDEAGFARTLEAAYRQMFEIWLASPAAAQTEDGVAAQDDAPLTLDDQLSLAKAELRDGSTASAVERLQLVAHHANHHEVQYWLASALLADGQTEAGEAALGDARTLHTVEALRAMGIDVARLRNDPAYASVAAAEFYRHKCMALASLAFLFSLTPETTTESALLNLGLSLQHQGRVEEAATTFRAAVDAFDSTSAHQFLLYSLFFVKDGARRYSAEAKAWAKRFTEGVAPLPAPFANDGSLDRKLKIGFVAPSFTRSQLKQFLTPVVAAHDPAKVELHFYSADPAAEDPLPQGVMLKIGGLSDRDAALAIRADGIDVLVDLWGVTAGGRLGVFAHRPAPVQISWMNLIQTTGMAAMDYVLHSDAMDVPGTQALFSEKILYIGPALAPYLAHPDRLPPTATPALSVGHVVFGAFINPARINDETIAAWARILKGRPGSRLTLKYAYYADPVLQRVFMARFAAHGVDPTRITFLGHTTGFEYLSEFGKIDLALDPSPCPGGTTTCDALAHGVPVLTMRGPDFYSRMGVPTLHGLPELVVDSWDDYVDRALALTADLPALNALRARVGPTFEASPVCDAEGFTRNIEQVYRDAFAAWAATRA